MTIDTRYVATLTDIRRVQVSCHYCALDFSFAPENIGTLPDVCPNCREAWFTQGLPSLKKHVQALIESVAQLRRAEGMRVDLALEFDASSRTSAPAPPPRPA